MRNSGRLLRRLSSVMLIAPVLNQCSVHCRRGEKPTPSTIDFPTWFSSGCYGGLACCMLAVVANALYTTIRRYGTTQQLAAAIILCVVCALLLLSAIVWYNLRFSIEQASLSFAEVGVMLAYVALCGWLV